MEKVLCGVPTDEKSRPIIRRVVDIPGQVEG